VEDQLGEGSTGFVVKFRLPVPDKPPFRCAAKFYYLQAGQFGFDKNCLNIFNRELKCLSTSHHENVIRYYGLCQCKAAGRAYFKVHTEILLMELMDKTFTDYYRDDLTDASVYMLKVTDVLLQVAKGLEYLHRYVDTNSKCEVKRIIHRDLTANNILLRFTDPEFPTAKISDFGFSRPISGNGSRKTVMSLHFQAPEMATRKYNEKVDIFSFGHLMLVSALSLETVCLKGDPKDTEIKRRRHLLKALSSTFIFNNSTALDKYKSLAEKCLSEYPRDRPDARIIITSLTNLNDTDEI